MTSYYPERLLLQWHITHRCNLRCTHCYQDTYAGAGSEWGALMAVLRQFRRFLRTAGIRGHISVTGGEPFAHPQFMRLLETFAEHSAEYSFAVLCNGSFVTAEIAARLKALGADFVQLSLEGGPATHDRIRGAGDFERTRTALKRLRAAGVRTMLSFTAHRENYLEFGEVSRVARALKVDKVWTDRLIPQGNGETHDVLTTEQTREFMALVARERADNPVRWFNKTEVAAHRALQFLDAGGKPYRCTAGDSLITVMPNGDLYPCRRLPIKVGNLHETPLSELYRSPLFQSLRDESRIDAACRSCLYKNVCRGGLKCLSYALTGSVHRADPGCWLAEPIASTMVGENARPACFSPVAKNGRSGVVRKHEEIR